MTRRLAALLATALLAAAAAAPPAGAGTDEGVDAFQHADFRAALEALRPEARKGDATAQLILGRMYAAGLGVAKDPRKAARYYAHAAESGLAEAELSYGYALFMGEGVRQDMVEALKWFILSADSGLEQSKTYVAQASKLLPDDMVHKAHNAAAAWAEKHKTANR